MAIDISGLQPQRAIEAGQIPDTGGQQQQQQEQPLTYAGQPCMVRSREQELVRHRGRTPQASEDFLVFQSCQFFFDKIEFSWAKKIKEPHFKAQNDLPES